MKTEIFEKNYGILNEKQKQAVDSLYGPIMVVAGPGTGKTQIIALRTANIILKTGVNPENILITTFTEAGVVAIRQRLIQFIGEAAYKVTVSTIHSFSQDIIKTFPEKFIQYKAGVAIDDVDQMEILKSILDESINEGKIVELTSDYDRFYYLRNIKSRISTLKQEGISLSKIEKLIQKQASEYEEELSEIKPTLKKYETTKEKHAKHLEKLRELSYLYEQYNLHLRQSSRYDFNDMINFVLQEFREDESLRLHYAEIYQFVMLDEYQDTNNPQNEIINLILSVDPESSSGGPGANIMVVGDDDQSIYRFQGANIENMLDFYTVYPETTFIVLENNYRSNQQILDTAKQLIDENKERLIHKIDSLDKKLFSHGKYKDSTEKPTLFRAGNPIEEKAYVLKHIRSEIESGTPLSEIAVIIRNNKELKDWTEFLSQNNIQTESKIQSNILESDYVNFILEYLRIIENPYENEHILINLLRTEILGLNSRDILKINRYLYIENYRRKIPLRYIDVLTDTSKLEVLELSDIRLLEEFTQNLFVFQKKLSETSLRDFLSFFIDTTGILEYVSQKGSFDDVQDIYTLLNTLKNWSIQDREMSMYKFFARIDLYKQYNYPINRQILKKSKSGVQIMTGHGSKGLEYEVVFIPGLYTGNWDGKKIPDTLKLPVGITGEGIQDVKQSSQEEERRLFFVALTRSKNKLFLSFPSGVEKKPLLPSLFLEEIADSLTEVSAPDDLEKTVESLVYNDITNSLIHYSNLEFDYIQEFLESYRLSPSDLNTFLRDPLEFLGRVIFKYPFSGNKFTTFGSVYHRTLELFYLNFKKDGIVPEKSYLIATFSHLIKQELLTSEELEEALEKGKTGLEGYHDRYASNLKEPFLLEYSFRRKNIFFDAIPLTGTIDKVEKLGETQDFDTSGSGQMAFFKDSVTLIDYKTGKVKTENVIKGLDRYGNKKPGEGDYFRQLMFYKLLCENDREFTEKFSIGSLAIDFVEGKDGKYSFLEVTPTSEEFEAFQTELKDSWEKISSIDFWKELLTK